MINPDQIHRRSGIITKLKNSRYEVKLENGACIWGWDLPSRFKIGNEVTVQFQYSIMLDEYVIKQIRKKHIKKSLG